MSMTVIDENKLLMALGMCARAGQLIAGVPMICDALRRGGAGAPKTVFIASDLSDNTLKRISDRTTYYKVKLVKLECDGATLAKAVGKSAVLTAVAVPQGQLLRLTEKYLREDGEGAR